MSLDALANLARIYPGGVPALAQRLGKHPGTLRAELSPPGGSTAKLGWLDALRIMQMCLQVGMPAALTPLDMAEGEFERVAIDMPRTGEAGDELLKRLAVASEEFSALMAEIAHDVSGGSVNDNQLRRIRAKGQELFGGLHALLRAVGELNAAAKPAQRARQGVAA